MLRKTGFWLPLKSKGGGFWIKAAPKAACDPHREVVAISIVYDIGNGFWSQEDEIGISALPINSLGSCTTFLTSLSLSFLISKIGTIPTSTGLLWGLMSGMLYIINACSLCLFPWRCLTRQKNPRFSKGYKLTPVASVLKLHGWISSFLHNFS